MPLVGALIAQGVGKQRLELRRRIGCAFPSAGLDTSACSVARTRYAGSIEAVSSLRLETLKLALTSIQQHRGLAVFHLQRQHDHLLLLLLRHMPLFRCRRSRTVFQTPLDFVRRSFLLYSPFYSSPPRSIFQKLRRLLRPLLR